MYKLTVLVFIALAAFVQGYGEESLLSEIARLMQTPNSVKTCPATTCCVEITHSDGNFEKRVLGLGESIAVSEDYCKIKRCTENGLVDEDIICRHQIETCPDGSRPVSIRCCPACLSDGIFREGSCQVTQWSPFGPCSASCEGGTRARTREAINLDGNAAFVRCVEQLIEFEDCNNFRCPRDCKWREGAVGECPEQCVGGEVRRYYEILQHPANGGNPCPPFVIRNETTIDPCCGNCTRKYRETECSVTCGLGVKTGYEVITKPAVNGGHCDNVQNVTLSCQLSPICCRENQTSCKADNDSYICIDDIDGDCVPDKRDNCKYKKNSKQEDEDRDGVGDECDNCIFAFNPDQANYDNDTTGNVCDADDDIDGIVDQNDNCPSIANPDQKDIDRDGIGDACDNCPTKDNSNQADFDEDGVGNACDNCRFYANPEPDPEDPKTFGAMCTVRPSYQAQLEEDEIEHERDGKENLISKIMERLLEMYYGNRK